MCQYWTFAAHVSLARFDSARQKADLVVMLPQELDIHVVHEWAHDGIAARVDVEFSIENVLAIALCNYVWLQCP